MHLVIGGDGLIGGALCKELGARNLEYLATTRRVHSNLLPPPPQIPAAVPFDLREAATADLPIGPMEDDGIVYLVAAVAGFGKCQTNPDAWRVNVDGPLRLAERLWRCFFVFISSDVVEMPGSDAYQTQKRYVELYFRLAGGMIIRPALVAPGRVGELAKVIVDEGLARQPGGLRWPGMERF